MHHNHGRVNVILGLKGVLGSLSRLKFSHCLSTNVLYQWRNQRLVSIAKSPLGELERSNTSLSGINPEKSDGPIPKSDLSKRRMIEVEMFAVLVSKQTRPDSSCMFIFTHLNHL